MHINQCELFSLALFRGQVRSLGTPAVNKLDLTDILSPICRGETMSYSRSRLKQTQNQWYSYHTVHVAVSRRFKMHSFMQKEPQTLITATTKP